MSTSTIKRKKHPYYDYRRVLSHNGVYNFIVGGRGIGKTYGAKKRAILANIKRGEEFIYLRRYKTELASAKNTFMADVVHEFPGSQFRYNGNQLQMTEDTEKPDKEKKWRTAGYFIALSTAQSQKSVSYPRVTLIIFDEFIIEKGATIYLPDEAKAFNNFYNTVDRYQDKTRVLFLANSVSITNPYFIEFNIRPDEESDLVKAFDGFVVCHFPDSEDFKNSIYQTKFGRFIQNTEYADYAVENEFFDNADNMLALKDEKARYIYSLETNRGTFSVWHNMFTNYFYVQKRLPKNQVLYTLLPERMDSDKTLLFYGDKLMGYLRTAFRNGQMAFDEPSTRNAFTEVFKR